MAEGRRADEWDRMSSLLCLLYNSNRDPKKGKAARPSDFNPFAKPVKEEPPPPVPFSILRYLFVPDSIPKGEQPAPEVQRLLSGVDPRTAFTAAGPGRSLGPLP